MEDSLYKFVVYIPLLPFFGFLIQALFGKSIIRLFGQRTGKKILGGVAVLAVTSAFGLGLATLNQLLQNPEGSRSTVVFIRPWIELASFKAPIEFLIDPLSVTMILIVTGIGALIHLYSTGYMSEEKDYARFFTYLNLFIVAMLTLVMANNLILLFVGWEGVGLCSYLLIGFWYKDLNNSRAANKAFIVNRIGDYGFILGMFLLFAVLATSSANHVNDPRYFSFDVINNFAVVALKHYPIYITAVALLLFVGAAGKSAQFPLYFWLPDAMAGPTPVSALIHAATMVTSGVFLLNRIHPIFASAPTAGAIIAMIGAFTALFAAVIAFAQTDIKKVLAFSTVSQLGFMFVACGAGGYTAGMFHVTTHAFFKALLFLGAGAVIHAMAHNQDMRNYGNLRKYLPITFVCMFIGFLAIAGFPFTSGFFSKDAIIGAAIGNGDSLVKISGFVALFTAFLTAIYMARLTWLTFMGKEERWRSLPEAGAHEHPNGEHEATEPIVIAFNVPDPHGFFYTQKEVDEKARLKHDGAHHDLTPGHTPHEVPVSMSFPLIVLAVPSAIFGLLFMGDKFDAWLSSDNPRLLSERPAEVPWLMIASGVASILGIIVGAVIYGRGLPTSEGKDETKWNSFRRAAQDQFMYDKGLTQGFTIGGRDIGSLLNGLIDRGLVDGSVNGLGFATEGVGLLVRKLQTGYIRFYALMMLLGVTGFVGYFFYATWGKL